MSLPPGVTPVYADPAAGRHPKDVLYHEIYDPFTLTWFRELDGSVAREELLAQVRPDELLKSLDQMNDLCHRLVEDALDTLAPRLESMLALAARHQRDVTWAGQEVPPAGATPEQLRASLTHKLKRNISLGAVEAVICLESGLRFCRDRLGVSGPPLRDMLWHSRQLYQALAYVHDDQEKTRLEFLTGTTGFLAYPDVQFHDVIDGGKYRIPADKFVVLGRDGQPPRLRFVPLPQHREPLTSPVMRCPAERLPGLKPGHESLNVALWSLLIEIYDRSGCFGADAAGSALGSAAGTGGSCPMSWSTKTANLAA